MDQSSFREAIARTWNESPPRRYQPANAALGIVGEVHEYAAEPTADELGDLLHYVATLRRLYEFPVADVGDPPPAVDSDLDEMRRLAGAQAEIVKKGVFHGADIGPELESITRSLLAQIAAEAGRRLGTSLARVRRHNVDKLEARYPDGFDAGRQP